GNHSPDDGGGIGCVGDILNPPSWSPLIKNNRIIGNDAQNLGGGLAFTKDINPEVTDNYISDNQTMRGDGGGICYVNVANSSALIERNYILSNKAGDHGGGIYAGKLGAGPPIELEVSWNLIW